MAFKIWQSTDELKQKLFYTSLELESLRTEATEEMRKNKESVKQLFHLLKVAYQERDEARDQLQKILTKIMPPSSTQRDQFLVPPHLPVPESPLLKPTKANSSITESNSLSDAYNHSSSPVDSLFDPVSSPEFSNFNIENHGNMSFVTSQQPFVQDYNNGTVLSNLIPSPKFDQASMVIDNMVKGKVLPQKGKLLQAVLEAGPLLQTLLVAGPLPRWRNPPPLQSFHIPPNCSHVFHVACIDTWFQTHSSCPLCRSGVFNLEYSVPICNLNETLSREELTEERAAFYHVLRSHVLRTTNFS